MKTFHGPEIADTKRVQGPSLSSCAHACGVSGLHRGGHWDVSLEVKIKALVWQQ